MHLIMRASIFIFLLSLLALAHASAATDQDLGAEFVVLRPGPVQDADIGDFKPSKDWLALVQKNGHWALIPTTVTISDENISSSHSRAIALLHYRGLDPGSVESPDMNFSRRQALFNIYRNGRPSTLPRILKLKFRDQDYRIEIDAKTGDISLKSGAISTVLDRERDDGSLIWAGDLNRDGKLDLIFSSGDEKNSTTCLFLSNEADKDKLVNKIGCQFYSG